MAHLPRRSAERRLSGSPLPLLALALVGAGAGAVRAAGAQEVPDRRPEPVGALLELGAGLTRLHGDAAPILQGAVLVALSPRVSVGGGGAVFPSDHEVEGDPVFPERGLGFGYGGPVVEADLPGLAPPHRVAVRALLGAGNVDLRDRRTGARLASDNVVVVEPAVVYRRPSGSRLALTLSLSWRAVMGLEDVDGVEAGDLSGPGLSLGLRFGPL